jgi:hypothetical protein
LLYVADFKDSERGKLTDPCLTRIMEILKKGDEPCECGSTFKDLLVPRYDEGAFYFQPKRNGEIRSYLLEQLEHFELEL